MARRKISKKTQKEVVKAAKKYPVITLVIVILLIISLVGCCVLHYKRIITIPFLVGIVPQEKQGDIITDDLQIHFLELGNANTGDCTLIKTGDTEILIDAGSKQNSTETLKSYIDQYCTDGVLEYVVATHVHEDHVAGFYGLKQSGAYHGIMYTYEIGTIIQFPLTKKTNTASTTVYGKYLDAVAYAESQGAQVYTALECYNNENGAQRTYTLADDITFSILYHDYYKTYDSGSDENNYSVCTLLSQGNNHYLFTGDLESEGEESLIEYNALPQVKLFKAGHHGSPTSSSSALMSVIKPEIVCVCCCCGNREYTSDPLNDFPSQAFVDRVAPYTDKIYVTTITDGNDGFMSYNGNIVVSSNGGDVTVNCSNNNTIFKDTQWFADNRTWPLNGVTSSE